MKTRLATATDLPELLALAREFIAESNYGWTFHREIAESTFRRDIDHEQTDVLVVDADGQIAGCAIVAHDRDFVEQRLGFIVKFFIRQAHRGTAAGRLLAAGCVEWLKEKLCWAAFVTATANIGAAQDRQFANLFAKFGFVACGPTLMRDFARG